MTNHFQLDSLNTKTHKSLYVLLIHSKSILTPMGHEPGSVMFSFEMSICYTNSIDIGNVKLSETRNMSSETPFERPS